MRLPRLLMVVPLFVWATTGGCGSDDGGGAAGGGGVSGWGCNEVVEGGGSANFGCFCTDNGALSGKCNVYTSNCVLYACAGGQCCECGSGIPDAGVAVATCPPPG